MALPINPYERHQKQAKHNEELLNEPCFPDPCTANPSSYKDWDVTILFYSALHYVQAYLCKNASRYRTSFINHTDRNNYLSNISMTDRAIASVIDDYVDLFNASIFSRYTACSYHYIKQKDICSYAKFALEKLPNALGF